jgi:two-component system sensor histidine kinase TctE
LLLTLVVGGGLVTYWVAFRIANSAYDRALLDPVIDLSDNIRTDANGARLELSAQAQRTLLYDQSDRLVFQIRAPDGKVIAGIQDLPLPETLEPSEKLFFDSVHRGQPIRVAAMRREDGFVTQVGETLNKRDSLIREILVTELVPTLLIAAVSIAVAWLGVARVLGPLERVRSELLERSPQHLQPIDDHSVPEELAPLVQAFNRLLDRLRDAVEMQQRLLANAAHQLRTPLAGLQMHLELLLRRELDPGLRAEVETMHSAMMRASRLARQLLALAKAESASSDPQPLRLLDLKSIADAAAQEWVPRAVERDIDLGFSLDSAFALGDPVLLRELLNNLVDNALRYTPAGGSITVRSGGAPDAPFLSVEDTGPGIPESARSRVFERFYRIDGSPGEGSGLGLAIVKEVVERHGGIIAIETPRVGHGTRITASFPPPREHKMPKVA